jgi:undecaprenyl-diphosphatase
VSSVDRDTLLTTTQAIVLGILQGLGEFLPISSSGHLIVVPWLLGWPDSGLAFDVALHLGTLAAVLFAFAADWVRLVASAVRCARRGRPFAEPEARLLWYLALASVPGAVAGVFLDEWAETVFRSPALVAVTMAVMGAVLLVADRRASRTGTTAEQATMRDALVIGCAQALALVPGVSRSGSTISAGLFLRYRREEAARFSFLLATPITFGAAIVKVPHIVHTADLSVVLPGMIAAAVFGFLAIRVLLAYVKTRDYLPFVVYRFAFSALVVAVLIARR